MTTEDHVSMEWLICFEISAPWSEEYLNWGFNASSFLGAGEGKADRRGKVWWNISHNGSGVRRYGFCSHPCHRLPSALLLLVNHSWSDFFFFLFKSDLQNYLDEDRGGHWCLLTWCKLLPFPCLFSIQFWVIWWCFSIFVRCFQLSKWKVLSQGDSTCRFRFDPCPAVLDWGCNSSDIGFLDLQVTATLGFTRYKVYSGERLHLLFAV